MQSKSDFAHRAQEKQKSGIHRRQCAGAIDASPKAELPAEKRHNIQMKPPGWKEDSSRRLEF
jgi:hypothetical protein